MPSSFVVVGHSVPRAWSLAVTEAPAMALPDGSVTRPVIPALASCALASQGLIHINPAINKSNVFRIRNSPLDYTPESETRLDNPAVQAICQLRLFQTGDIIAIFTPGSDLKLDLGVTRVAVSRSLLSAASARRATLLAVWPAT